MTPGRPVLAIAAIALASVANLAVRAQQGGGQPGTTWNEARLRDAIDVARVGRKSKPGVWFATGEQIATYVKTSTPR